MGKAEIAMIVSRFEREMEALRAKWRKEDEDRDIETRRTFAVRLHATQPETDVAK